MLFQDVQVPDDVDYGSASPIVITMHAIAMACFIPSTLQLTIQPFHNTTRADSEKASQHLCQHHACKGHQGQ